MKKKNTTQASQTAPLSHKLPAFRKLFERLPLPFLRALGTIGTVALDAQNPEQPRLVLIAGEENVVVWNTPKAQCHLLDYATLTINDEGEHEITFKQYKIGRVSVGFVTQEDFDQLCQETVRYEESLTRVYRSGNRDELFPALQALERKRVQDVGHLITQVLAERVKAELIAKAMRSPAAEVAPSFATS